ncbi:MAG: elongation factor P maturation arginine rhamnosyltransferase EarP [Burkholderiaceae bacterium]
MRKPPPLQWDIFCQVIDNHGDIGVCWRLACNLAQRSQQVRLWVDDANALAWMAPGGHPGVAVQPWADAVLASPADVVIEAFGCALPPETIATMADFSLARAKKGLKNPVWINLEYLSAEPYVERNHRLPSPQKDGLTKHFFYPGFTLRTGGLLREPDLAARQARFDRAAWLQSRGLDWRGERLVSLFCYEPAALGALLQALRSHPSPTRLLVTAGRSQKAVFSEEMGRLPALSLPDALSISYLPYLSQTDFDHLLWACDFNFVRGEDSLVRALWAARPGAGGGLEAIPFIWQIYPQTDGAHHAKLAAFLAWLDAGSDLPAAHRFWNGLSVVPAPLVLDAPNALATAQRGIQQARARLLAQPDLAEQLLGFVQEVP